jgi:hypothetical protein
MYADFYIWKVRGKPTPSPHIFKQATVKRYAQEYAISLFIETGTFLGDMVDSVKHAFSNIYTIELGQELYQRARDRFSSYNHIKVYLGDSSIMLGSILDTIQEPCLFWLDAHYSEGITAKGSVDSPILIELENIFQHPYAKKHVILIDDARLFTGEHDYPEIYQIHELAQEAGFDTFEVTDDIIRVHN